MSDWAKTAFSVGVSMLGTAGLLWVFADKLMEAQQMELAAHEKVMRETVIHIGRPGPSKCSANIALSVWEQMNRIGVYKWVAACEGGQP